MPANSAGLDDADERLFKVQLAMAEKGDTRAQYFLGEMHEQGLGTKQDADEAFKWYTKAAEQGDSLALRKLAHRKEIIDEPSLLKMFAERKDFRYVTDVAPDCEAQIKTDYAARYYGTVKKQGAQTEEANINAGLAAARQIVNYLTKGDKTFQVN